MSSSSDIFLPIQNTPGMHLHSRVSYAVAPLELHSGKYVKLSKGQYVRLFSLPFVRGGQRHTSLLAMVEGGIRDKRRSRCDEEQE
jgi:hypothetical protein